MTRDQMVENLRLIQQEIEAIGEEGCTCPFEHGQMLNVPPCPWCASAGPGLLDEAESWHRRLREHDAAHALSQVPGWGRF